MKGPFSWERALGGIVSSAGVIFKRDNAINPMIGLATLGAVVLFGAAYYMPTERHILVISGIGLFASAAIAYFILLFRDPDRLQSEKHQLALARMQQVIGKEFARPLSMDELAPPIANPSLPQPKTPATEIE